MSTLQLTQKELKSMAEAGTTQIWQYNTLYQVEYSRGMELFVARKTHMRRGSLIGVTGKGRFIAMTPERAQSFIDDKTFRV